MFDINSILSQLVNIPNPQAMAMKTLQRQSASNPQAKRLYDMLNSGDTEGAGEMISNLASQYKLDMNSISKFIK